MTLRSRLRPYVPPVTMFAGLAIFAASLLFLMSAASGEREELAPAYLETVNGTALLVYPSSYFGTEYGELAVNYTFPLAAGDAFFLSCEDTDRVRAGQNATQPFLAFRHLRENQFVASAQTVGAAYRAYTRSFDRDDETRTYCYTAAVVFAWNATGGDPVPNRPTVSVVYTPADLDAADLLTFLLLSIGGATLVLAGGLAWARDRTPATELPRGDDSTAEALRHALDQMAAQMERARRHLLSAGVLGIFLWYPLLVPWAWTTAKDATNSVWIPWVVALAAATFLAVLTFLWAREFSRLDRTLRRWRARLAELRAKEETLLAELQGG